MRIVLSAAIFFAALRPIRAQETDEIEHFSIRAGGNLSLAASKTPGRLRVVVGGAVKWLSGASTGFERALLESAELDALALASDELEAAAAKPEILKIEKLPLVAANVIDEGTGKPIVRTHVVVKNSIAFVGVTWPTRKSNVPKGWRLEEPAAALKRLLPDLSKEVKTVILLASMDRLDAAKLLKEFSGLSGAIVPARGANDSDVLKIGSAWLVQTPDGASVAGRLSPGRGENEAARVKLSDTDWEKLQALAAKHGFTRDRFVSKQKPTGGVEEGPASKFEAGRRTALWIESKNRALEVRAESFLVASEYGGRKAADGRAWLVVVSEWTNAIPLSYAFGNETPVAFQIDDFKDILFVVINGSRLARLDPELTAGPGGLTEKPFKLELQGSSRKGVAVFDVPAAGIETLDLRFYDLTHGHIALPLLARKEAAKGVKPAAGPAKNELLEAEVLSVKKSKKGAPDGMTYVTVDLCARGAWSVETDATVFDPKAKKGDRMKVPTFGKWEDIHRLVSLVVDGESAATPLDSSALGDQAMLLPDTFTGNALVFLVPGTSKSLELRIDFVPMAVPDRADPLLPEPLTFKLEGERPKAPNGKALASAKEGEVQIAVTGKSLVKRFAGAEAGEGKKLLVVDISVLNGGEGRLFEVKETVSFAPEQGDPIALHDASWSGARPPVRFLPKGERRVFQAVFEIDEKSAKHRIKFGEQVLELP